MRIAFAERQSQWKRDLALLMKLYQYWHRRELRIGKPRRYTEKIQWRKLCDRHPLFPTFCDKWAVRDFIARRIGANALVPILWRGADPADIPFDQLTPPYVVKTSHASGQVIIVREENRELWQKENLVRQLRDWLAEPYGKTMVEIAYLQVPRQVLIEKLIVDPNGKPPMERRCFVFHGKVRVINTVLVMDGKVRNGAFHTPAWERLYWYFGRPPLEMDFPAPPLLEPLIKMAEQLGADCDHLRVDFFDTGEKLWAGEITVYPWSGSAAFKPDQADLIMGQWWDLRWPRLKALRAKWLPRRHGHYC
jgi:hypothetical protein